MVMIPGRSTLSRQGPLRPARVWQALLLGLLTLASPVAQAAPDSVPTWLAGPPDLEQHPRRCHLYAWIFDEADRQTANQASQEALARDRLINLANRLADHHQANPGPHYAVELRYLVLGPEAPHHAILRIDAQRLDHLLSRKCSGGDTP